jgi:DnaK suppressor protein
VAKKIHLSKEAATKSKAASSRRASDVRGALAAKRDVAASPAETAVKPLRKTPLSKAELEEFRKMLMDKRHAILGDMTGMEAQAFQSNRQDRSGDLSNIPIHPADVGTDNFEQEFTLGLLESERTLLREIDEALDRIKQGTYGICLATGKPIDKARLKARPWAKHCIEYARLVEKGLVPRESASAASEEEDAEGEGESESESEGEAEAEPVEEEPFEGVPEE